MKTRHLGLLFGLIVFLNPLIFAQGIRAEAESGVFALIRIDPRDDRELAELAELKLLVAEKLYTSAGDLFLVAAADQPTLQVLQRRNIPYKVLDADMEGADYHLLYGSVQAHAAASELTRILLREGQLALARTSPNELASLIELGLDISPLAPSPLVAPRPQTQVEALPAAITPDPIIQEMLTQVSSLELYNYVGGLSGEWAVTISGSPYTIATRFSLTDTPITKATRRAYEILQSLGLSTWYDYYFLLGAEKRSVIAQQIGLTEPEKIVLLTAHLDSTSYVNGDPYTYAPGADDNASGSAALLHIADILSQYDFGCTLRYALFTGEEQGMVGSQAYAADVYAMGENLRAVLNLDMLGYNTPSSPPVAELHTRYANTSDLAIANLFRDSVFAYGVPLNPLILQDGKTFSDHSSFWNYNYPAILAIEDWDDHTPYYHKTSDQLETLNFTYYTNFTRAALAAFAHLGCLLEGTLTGTVRDAETQLPVEGAAITTWDGFRTRSTSSDSNGVYQLILPPGSYTVEVSALDHLSSVFTGTVILNAQSTGLNPLLTPCLFVREVAASPEPHSALVDEVISFSASAEGELPLEFSWDFTDGQFASGPATEHAFAARGTYPVELTVNNACGFPQTVLAPVFVEVDRYFLPIGIYTSGE